jgi:hypothetical protein
MIDGRLREQGLATVPGEHDAQGCSERSVTMIKVTTWSDCLHNYIKPEYESEHNICRHNDCGEILKQTV